MSTRERVSDVKVIIHHSNDAGFPGNCIRVYYPKAKIKNCDAMPSGIIIASAEADHLCALLSQILEIEGVGTAVHSQEGLTVRKSPAYEWEELEEKVLGVLADFLKVNPHELETSLQDVEPEHLGKL